MAKLPNTVLRVAARSLAIAAAVLGLAAGAQAQTIAAWSANGTNAPSYVDPNFTATNLSGNVPFGSQTIGYIPEGDAWSVAFGSFGTNPLPSFSTSVTAGITTMVGNFKFTLFNNDCETNGNPFSNCTGVK